MEDELQKLREENAQLRARLLSIDDLCPFCKQNRADTLCDATLGHELDDNWELVGYPCFAPGGERFTCDMSICDQCRTQGTPIFFCGSAGAIVVPDFCPIHKDWASISNRLSIIRQQDAVAWRARAQMLLQMAGVSKIPVVPEVDYKRCAPLT